MKKVSLTELNVPGCISRIDEIVSGLKAYQVLFHAVDKKLFDWLDNNGKASREEIASAINLNGMFSRCYLQSLIDMGMLTCEGEHYTNSDIADSLLVSSSPGYQGDWFKSFHGNGSKWDNLELSLSMKKPQVKGFNEGPTPEFIHALAQRSLRGELQEVVKSIIAWDGFSASRRAIDIGGGHGLYALALCQNNSNLGAVVFDKPHVATVTQQYIEHYGMSKQVSTSCGNIEENEIGGGYDIMIISHLLYKYRKELPTIFAKAYKGLNVGGLLVLNHWFCNPGCAASPDGLTDLDKSLHSFGHPLCHPEEFNATLKQCGFETIMAKDFPSVYGISKLVLCSKKQGLQP